MSNYSDSKFTSDPNTPWYKVMKLVPVNSKVLDVGCSSGNFGQILKKNKKCTVDGIELDPTDAKAAQGKLRNILTLNIETDDLRELDKDYDVIYFGDVIEHLVNPALALKRVKSLLNTNGSIIFSIPNMAHISVRIMLMQGAFEYGETGLLDRTHLHFYTSNEIERVFNEAGYEIKALDWVSRDVPKKLLDADLEKIGLKAKEEFYEKTKSLDYAAYQFIGVAKPVKGHIKISPRPKVSPSIDMFERHLSDIRESYENDIKRLRIELEEKHNIEKKALLERINYYENSKSWKVTKPLREAMKLTRGR